MPSGAAGFAIGAPVSANSKHLATAFGGSINAVATLAAYVLLWLELRGERAEVVISESAIRFYRPIRHVIQAICARPEATLLQEFRGALRTKSRARLTLHVQVLEEKRVAAEFTGTFVAILPTSLRREPCTQRP